ncbi:TetR family transcriptional regulator [Kineosporia rhizophila]|uniref:acyl-CoA-like ligand-binding transcription factor n=1 Tax=Kineosporia TaxID=49184 RepID=UPI001E60457B|nr:MULTISPECIES: TetR family transcriptional regulator [Kineosporia]MCE0540841.1 TetR family transcriptional regulator [Kineosporia rhizophila]
MTGPLGGRPATTSARALADVAQRLFLERGFEEVSVEDIAAAAGISRRTFFRYFSTKSDVLWVETAAENQQFTELLAAAEEHRPYDEVLSRAALTVHRITTPAKREWALHRAQLVFSTPAVQAQLWGAFEGWRSAGRAFAARQTGHAEDGFFPVAVGQALVAAMLTGHQYWVGHPDTELEAHLVRALALHLPPDPRFG